MPASPKTVTIYEMDLPNKTMDLQTPVLPTKLNNRGAYLLRRELYDEAVAELGKALKVVRCFMRANESESHNKVLASFLITPTKPTRTPGMRSTKQTQHSCSKKRPQSKRCAKNAAAQGGSRVYSRGFVFSDPIIVDLYTISFERDYLMRLTSVIVFNLGIAHHLRSLHDSHASISDLARALSLYELSYKIQVKERVQLKAIYRMAILNNIGQVYASNGNKAKANECFRCLLKHVLLYSERSQNEHANPEQLGGFFENTMSVILRDPAMAPAA
jgi:tetratricopeptide (TPR) repeat protein